MKNKPTTTGEQAYLLSISNLMQKKKKKSYKWYYQHNNWRDKFFEKCN